jgi:hypothetical protein
LKALKYYLKHSFLFLFKDPKLLNQLTSKHGETLDEKSLTLCSGEDYINIHYQHVVCPDAETAKVIKNENQFTYIVIYIKSNVSHDNKLN